MWHKQVKFYQSHYLFSAPGQESFLWNEIRTRLDDKLLHEHNNKNKCFGNDHPPPSDNELKTKLTNVKIPQQTNFNFSQSKLLLLSFSASKLFLQVIQFIFFLIQYHDIFTSFLYNNNQNHLRYGSHCSLHGLVICSRERKFKRR